MHKDGQYARNVNGGEMPGFKTIHKCTSQMFDGKRGLEPQGSGAWRNRDFFGRIRKRKGGPFQKYDKVGDSQMEGKGKRILQGKDNFQGAIRKRKDNFRISDKGIGGRCVPPDVTEGDGMTAVQDGLSPGNRPADRHHEIRFSKNGLQDVILCDGGDWNR